MKKLLFISILLLAIILRFWQLDSFPALNADEAAIGYNAYSFLQTGKDEHGNPWPIHFQSFNDYKPGLYVYMVMPFVAVLGLSEWAIRIPSALLGVASVWIIYLLAKELKKNTELFPLLCMFMLTISPWHVHFSRGGWEVNVATFFITSGLLLFFIGLRNQKYLAFSVLAFALSLYTYHAARIIVPLLGIGLIFLYGGQLWKNKKNIGINGVLGIVLLVPLFIDLLGPAGISRAAGVGLFADQGPLNRINEERGEHGDYTSLFPKLIHNKGVNYSLAFASNWAKHYHGEFLFLSGDVIERNKVPETGQLYLFEIITLIVGLWGILGRSKEASNGSQWRIILWWLLIAPVAAALTFQSPHALRAQNMVMPLEIISAYGLYRFIIWCKDKIRVKSILVCVYGLILIAIAWNFLRYEHMYWVHMAKEYPYSSQYGVKELVKYMETQEKNYQNIVVTTRYDQPYILFLFYMNYPPQKFQDEHILTNRDKYGFSTVNHFDKYYFQPIEFTLLKGGMPSSLIVGTSEEIPKDENVVKKIYGSNGFEYFDVVAD